MPIFALKTEIFLEIAWKIDIFWKFGWKNRKLFLKLPEKIEIFRKFSCKNRFFFTRIHDPQISNQIDAADRSSLTIRVAQKC